MKILITICARGGSKSIPGKNIKLLAGKPLIEYSIKIANQFKNKYEGVDIALSSDSEEIIELVRKTGFNVPYKRPDLLATDNAGKIEALTDVLKFFEKRHGFKYDYILDLDVTSPLRSLEDLTNAFQIIQNDNSAYNLFSVSPASRNPYFNMVEEGRDGYYHLSKKIVTSIVSRQSAPKVFDLNASFYFYRRTFFDKKFRSAVTKKSLIYEVPHICFDLDHPIDFDYMEFLLLNKKLNFDIKNGLS